MGKFDWGVRYVIIFLYVQFWIRLATVSYRGKKVRTVDSSAVRSVNKPRDTRNCVQNEPKYAIRVLFATHLYYKALRIISCALIQEIRHNCNRLDDANVKLQVTARCQRWARPVSWGVFDWVIGNELIFRSSHFLIRLVPVTKQLHDRGYFVLTDQIWPVTYICVFDWAIGTELIFRFWPFPIRLVPVTRRLLDRGHFILTGQKWLVT